MLIINMGRIFWYILTAEILELFTEFCSNQVNEIVSSDSKFMLAAVIAIIFIAIDFSILFANSKVNVAFHSVR